MPVFLLGERCSRLRPALWGFAGGTMAVASVVGSAAARSRRRQRRRGGRRRRGRGRVHARRRGDCSARMSARGAGMDGAGGRGLGAGLLRAARAQRSGGPGDRHRVCVRDRGPGPVRDPRDRASERPGGNEHGDPDGRRPALAHAAVLGRRADERPAAGGGRGRLTRSSSRSQALLPVSFAFAAGAMLALVAFEFVPQALAGGPVAWRGAGAAAGAALMLGLAAVLGV